MHVLGLEYLSVFGLDPVAYVHLAADLGCDFVSLNLRGAANRLPIYPPIGFRDDPRIQRSMMQALRERGVGLLLVEGFSVRPDASVDALKDDLDLVAEMGAASICAVSTEKDMPRTFDEFSRITEMAAQRNLITTTEVGAGVLRNLDAALAAMKAVGRPDFKLLVDTMHFFRSGSTNSDFAALDPVMIGHIQLCDVPMPRIIESYMQEALFERRAPGDGDLPLAEFLALAPEGVPIGLEIPIRSRAEVGDEPHARLKPCVDKTRQLLAARNTSRPT